MVAKTDLKSVDHNGREGSSPSSGTNLKLTYLKIKTMSLGALILIIIGIASMIIGIVIMIKIPSYEWNLLQSVIIALGVVTYLLTFVLLFTWLFTIKLW